jgi:hypothetical protein
MPEARHKLFAQGCTILITLVLQWVAASALDEMNSQREW